MTSSTRGMVRPEALRLGLSGEEWLAVREETVRLTQRLISIDTSNPPGNETALAGVLQAYLADAGVDAELHGESPQRMNLVARLKGDRPGPRVLLLSHEDVVPAPEEDWIVPPFSGALEDGCVWGRGALDMKNQMAAHAVAVARLARSGKRLAGEVILAATSDEEVRDRSGARWLLENRRELVDCDYLITEPVVDTYRAGEVSVFPLTVGEKTVAMFRLRIHGQGGHASEPRHGDNPVVRLGEVLRRLEECEPETIISPELRAYIQATVSDPSLRARLVQTGAARAALRELALAEPDRARKLEPLYGATFSPTVLRCNSRSVNVIPTEASVDVDCRLLPSQDPEHARSHVARALAGFPDWEFEWVELEVSGESPKNSPLRDAVERVIARMSPRGQVMTIHSTAGTDCPWFRAALPNVIAYGFCPSFTTDTARVKGGMHTSNEHIPADDLGLQALFFEHAVADLLGC
jgi:acetylornithine deacetylase/succinyl-diaminopimelate desuccinylase-like protein